MSNMQPVGHIRPPRRFIAAHEAVLKIWNTNCNHTSSSHLSVFSQPETYSEQFVDQVIILPSPNCLKSFRKIVHWPSGSALCLTARMSLLQFPNCAGLLCEVCMLFSLGLDGLSLGVLVFLINPNMHKGTAILLHGDSDQDLEIGYWANRSWEVNPVTSKYVLNAEDTFPYADD